MVLVLIIVIAIAAFYFISKANSGHSSSSSTGTSDSGTSYTSAVPSSSPAQPVRGGSISVSCSSTPFRNARFEDGTVYCRPSNGAEFVVGYYEVSPDGESCKALCEFDKSEVANIVPDGSSGMRVSIYLTRMGLYNRYIKTSGYIKYPNTPIWECATAQYGTIEDAETHTSIATYSGDTKEASAAFACLCYEALSDTKYNQFFERDNW